MILNLDTSTEAAGISLAREGRVMASAVNHSQKDHAAWLHPAIEAIMKNTANGLKDLKAVAVTSGPGSYTGLRVSMAAAKGLCYALEIPLILIPTLKTMAFAMREVGREEPETLYCPMIDARRMEVFAAVYNSDMEELLAPSAIILEKSSFDNFLINHPLIFAGSGAAKWKDVQSDPNARFLSHLSITDALASCSHNSFMLADFADISRSEPLYLKEFYTHGKK